VGHVAGYRIVVIGTSWGGLHALSVLVRGLPADFPLPLAIVQHRSRDSEGLLGELLQDETALRVSEVEDKEPILPGHVYVAPPTCSWTGLTSPSPSTHPCASAAPRST